MRFHIKKNSWVNAFAKNQMQTRESQIPERRKPAGIFFYQFFFLLFLKVIFLVPERRKAAAGARKRSAEAWRWDARSSPHNTAGQSSCVKVIVNFIYKH